MPSRTAAAVDEALTPVRKSDARIAPCKIVARTTPRRNPDTVSLSWVAVAIKFSMMCRAAEHRARLCVAPPAASVITPPACSRDARF
jgi:hypothetical protein